MLEKMSKQDRQGVRKARDVERKYNLGDVVQTVRVVQENVVPKDMLENYYSKDEIDYKTYQLQESLGNYYTKSEVDNKSEKALENYYTKDEVDNKSEEVLENYYSKDEVDNKTNQLKEDLESQIPNGDYRETEGVIEWINPPMALDTEYRTVERWMSKPVYTKLVRQDISLRGSTSVEYETPYQIEVDVVTPDFEQLIRANGYTTGYTNIIIPQMSEDGYMLFGSVSADKIYVNVKNHLFTNDAFLYIQIWYTKSTL